MQNDHDGKSEVSGETCHELHQRLDATGRSADSNHLMQLRGATLRSLAFHDITSQPEAAILHTSGRVEHLRSFNVALRGPRTRCDDVRDGRAAR